MSAVLKQQPGTATANDAPASGEGSAKTDETIDGFHLVIEALKLNGIDTVFGLPGIPITDLTRKMQAEGLRVISFRHEQHAGNAAAAAGFLTGTPGICLTVSAPGFLNGLTALANATTNCFPMILISGSSEREIVDLQQGDYEEMDQLAIAKPLCKAAFRVLHAADIGVGIARAIRSALSGRPGGVYLDLPAKLFAQTMDAVAGKKSLIKVVDAAPRQIPAPDAVKRAVDLLKGAKKPLIVLGKGAAYAQADTDIRALHGVRRGDLARRRVDDLDQRLLAGGGVHGLREQFGRKVQVHAAGTAGQRRADGAGDAHADVLGVEHAEGRLAQRLGNRELVHFLVVALLQIDDLALARAADQDHREAVGRGVGQCRQAVQKAGRRHRHADAGLLR
jgi:hypothetical protein